MATIANNIMSGLQQSANVFVNRVRIKLAPKGKNGYPAEIAENISISSPIQEGENKYSITISFSAIMAAAFEFGSGIHAEFGPQITYPIVGKPILSFPKERWPNYQPGPNGKTPDIFHFTFVNHPGIVARPFIRPSITETKPEIAKILGEKFKASILLDLKEVWSS